MGDENMNISVKKYLSDAISHAESTLSGNYKTGNVAATEIGQMNNYITTLEDTETAYKFIDEIINSNIPNAVMWIAPVCVKKRYRINTIRNKLINYSNDKTLGILSLNAAMFLKTL